MVLKVIVLMLMAWHTVLHGNVYVTCCVCVVHVKVVDVLQYADRLKPR